MGEAFAGCRFVRAVGSGGMGEVYPVRHPRLPPIFPARLGTALGNTLARTPMRPF